MCEITGVCVKNRLFAENTPLQSNSITPICPSELTQPPGRGCSSSSREAAFPRNISRKSSLELEQVSDWVFHMICSPSTRASLVEEMEKRQARLQFTFIKAVKTTRTQNRSLNLIRVCSEMATSVQHCRVPKLMEPNALRTLADTCTRAVFLFLRRYFNADQRVSIPTMRMRGFVIGVLYLMRTGMCLRDSVEILPRIHELSECLPLENQLQTRFNVSTKIITDAENCLKRSMRGLSRHRLEALGFEV